MKFLKTLLLITAIIIIASCKKAEKAKEKIPLIELTSSYFTDNQNTVIYYTKSENLDSIRTALVKEMDRLSKEQKINFFKKGDYSKLICFNNKNLMPNITNNPDEKLKGKYNKSIICILSGTSWGNHKFLYGGVKDYYKGNISGFQKVVFRDKKTGKWEDWK